MNVKIILICNNEYLIEHVTSIIKKTGFIIERFGDLHEASLHIEAGGADIIILDEDVASGDSLDCCATLRQKYQAPIIMTGRSANGEAMIKAITSGADFYMQRPLSEQEFIARINSMLRRKHYAQLPNGSNNFAPGKKSHRSTKVQHEDQ